MKAKNKSNVKLIVNFLKGSKSYFIFATLLAALVSVFELINPRIIGYTVDYIIGTDTPKDQFVIDLINYFGGAENLRSSLYFISLAIIIIAFVTVALRYAFRIINAVGAETFVKKMRDDIFTHIEHLPFSWHMKNNTGDIIQRCTSDIDMVKRFVSDQLTSLLRVVMQIVLSVVFMLTINVKLSIIPIISIPIILTYSIIFRGKISKNFKDCDENEGILSAIAQENLTGVRVVRAFGREKYEQEKFTKQNYYYTGLWTKLMKLMSWFWSIGDLLSGLQLLIIVVFGSILCINNELTLGEFITFVSYNTMLIWPVKHLGRVITDLSKAGISIDRLAYIMDSKIEEDPVDAIEPDMTGDINFEHVTYSYNDKKKHLDDVTFNVKSGMTVGILGGTGSGKSTLMCLLTKLYDLPKENGQITISGVDIAKIKRDWFRKNVSIVLQEPYLFSRSIAENIGITEDNISLTDIREAAKIAALDETVMSFTNAYDTYVGERGVTLSGGQKQRAAIARIIMQKAPIMIFDDSLSAVDTETDSKIRTALKDKLEKATVFLVSHRITTLMHSDLIVVLDHGKIAEMGSHEDLISKDGIYKKIYDIQIANAFEIKDKEAAK